MLHDFGGAHLHMRDTSTPWGAAAAAPVATASVNTLIRSPATDRHRAACPPVAHLGPLAHWLEAPRGPI